MPNLDPFTVKKYFERRDLNIIDEKQKLKETVKKMIAPNKRPVFLLLMSSGTFDGIDWNAVSSH